MGPQYAKISNKKMFDITRVNPTTIPLIKMFNHGGGLNSGIPIGRKGLARLNVK